MECAKVPNSRVQRLPPEDGASFLLCFQFGFHAKDNEESFSDSESGNDVMGLLLRLQLDWRLFKLEARK